MQSIIKKIKEKYELRNLPDSLVKSTLESYLKKNKIKNLDKEKNQKIVIKEVRSILRRYAGQYASKSNIKNMYELVKKGKFEDILKEHSSTRERLEDYPLVIEVIKKINPKSILDLGCGINPVAIAQSFNKAEYHAYDINNSDLEIVEKFFKSKKINGFVYNQDIRNIGNFPKADLCIIFKVLDILGEKRNEISSKLLKEIDSKYFLVSFPTKTLTGKPMSVVYRRWFEKILEKLSLNYEVKRTSQELFYIIRKA